MLFTTWVIKWIETPRNFKGSAARKFLDAAPDYPCYAALLYLVCVFFLPGLLKRRRWVFNIHYVVAPWNLALSLISTLGSYYCLDNLFHSLVYDKGFHRTCCEQLSVRTSERFHSQNIHNSYYDPSPDGAFDAANIHRNNPRITTYTHQLLDKNYDGPRAFYTALFMYLKTPELLDTVFLILQDKPVSFLHWYHHIVTAMYVWICSYRPIPSGIFFCAMNYFVHSIMYFYYFLVVMGLRRSIRPFAPVITLLQVLQMFLGMFITVYTYFQYWLGPEHSNTLFFKAFAVVLSSAHYVYHHARSVVTTGAPASQVPAFDMSERFWGCDSDPTNLRVGMMMYGSYCLLFAVLFKELYIDKRAHKNSLVLARKEQEAKEGKSWEGDEDSTNALPRPLSQQIEKLQKVD